jgi:hypothetical protein
LALEIVLALVAANRPLVAAVQPKPLTRRFVLNPFGEEILELDFGSGAGSVKTIRLQQGAIGVDLPVTDLLQALGAKTGD